MMREYSYWWVEAINHKTKQKKKHIIRFFGPMPLGDELDFWCPPDVCAITSLSLSSVGETKENWIDDSDESQAKLFEQMQQNLQELRKEHYGK